ncbi:carbohydrate ABC transporter permease [Actinocrispum wychmicini]|uniref:Multiple sugar transport system permease protein n=1 Tax=Actinocrispum wychmicini TaxID=1213861 RepID=A0A4R2JP08_9PSEU|nr:sugar ABC transporter permease [Actinocrispum wychmicini]TCO55895.1 multiple sugar transport system permease protein [Actinocrispum wychmicini]
MTATAAVAVPAKAPAAPGRRRLGRRGGRGGWAALAFLAPALLTFGYFAWWPMISSVVLAFQRTNLIDPARWVGWDNFRTLFADPLLAKAAGNTLWFTILALVIGFPVPLVLAVMMSELRRLGGLMRVLVYLPVAMPPVVAVLLWKWFYDPDFGLFNKLAGLVGVAPLSWLQSAGTAMPSLVLEATWATAGSTVLIYLAALAGVSRELYDAAEIDGASIWRRLWHVTLPQLRGILLLILLLQVIGTFQVFTEPFVMTDGGPDDATVTVLLLLYRYAFVYGDYGAAAALSVLLVITLGLLSATYLRLTRRWSSR